MPLLAEYGLIPDVFDGSCYTTADLCDVHLQNLKEALLSEAVVRDLRDGHWSQLFSNTQRPWHKRGTELLRKLVSQNRLRLTPAALPNAPANDREWCDEAILSHAQLPLEGVITTRVTKSHYAANALIASVNRLSSATWWSSRSPSVRLGRTLVEYKNHLKLIFACINSVMFIDAHLDPSQNRYADFTDLLLSMQGRIPVPQIEVHRVCYVGTGRDRQIKSTTEWEGIFRAAMATRLAAAGLGMTVYIWDDFHDRHVITDLIGLALQNGLDTTSAPNAKTTWTRLGRGDRDDIQREFDPASQRHDLKGRFQIP